MSIILGTLQQGILFGLLAIGIYIAFRILDIPDLTAEGSFTFGIAVSAVVTIAGHPLLAILAGTAAGFAAGILTGIFQTKCGIHPVLAGILTMSGLYSINTWVLGEQPSINLISSPQNPVNTVFSIFEEMLSGIDKDIVRLGVIFVITAIVSLILILFFKTRTGLSIRAAGDNDTMVRASSINVDRVKILALAVGNSCIGMCGAIYAQYQRFADINSGAGMLVVGLASVIIGEVFVGKKGVTLGIIFAVVGSVVYRGIIAAATYYDIFPAYMLKLVAAVIVAAALTIPAVKNRIKLAKSKKAIKNAGSVKAGEQNA